MYLIISSNAILPIDRAVKKNNKWIGEFSGISLKEIQKKYPDAKVVKEIEISKKLRG